DDEEGGDRGRDRDHLAHVDGATPDLLDREDGQVPAIEGRQREEVQQTDEHVHDTEQEQQVPEPVVGGEAPGDSADADDAGGVLNPSRFVCETEGGGTPDPPRCAPARSAAPVTEPTPPIVSRNPGPSSTPILPTCSPPTSDSTGSSVTVTVRPSRRTVMVIGSPTCRWV